MSTLSIYPLGDAAVTAELGGAPDEALNDEALSIRDYLLRLSASDASHVSFPPGVTDIIVAWHTVTVFFDPLLVPLNTIADLLATAHASAPARSSPANAEPLLVPVCYGGTYGPDLEWLARASGLLPDDCIRLHQETVYRVYMVGFLPGFPYLGPVEPRLQVPRKDVPVPVKAGSVGIAGRQTGIYPLDSPGGWRIIGRTPWTLFDPAADPPIRLQTGDRVRFFAIRPEEFGNYSIKS